MRATFTGRRQAERRDCSIKAQAHSYDGSPAVDCIVTDWSPTGAKIVFPPGYEPAAAFDLFVPSRGDTRHALVRWKAPDAIGVEFIQARGTTEDQRFSEMLVRVCKLEEELRAMRAEVVLVRAAAGAPPDNPRAFAGSTHEPEGSERDAIATRLAALEERSAQDRTEWEALADKVAAIDARPFASQASSTDTALAERVTRVEARGDDILGALKTTLALLNDLREATAPPMAKAG